MKSVASAFLILVISASSAAAARVPDQVFRDCEGHFMRATIAADSSQLDSLLARDYVSVGLSGQIRSRSEVIKAFSSGVLAITSSVEDGVTIRQYGGVAIVNGFITLVGKESGADVGGRYAFTRVYKRSDGKWQAVSFQATPVISGK